MSERDRCKARVLGYRCIKVAGHLGDHHIPLNGARCVGTGSDPGTRQPDPTPTVSPEEHRRVQERLDATLRLLQQWEDYAKAPMGEGLSMPAAAERAMVLEGRTHERWVLKSAYEREQAERFALTERLAKLEAESADLRAENEHLENERDIARGDAESAQERERNALSLLASVRESLNAESADLRTRLERAEGEARTLREVHISPAEVRRAVEEETERIKRVILGGSFLYDQAPTAVWARQLVETIDRDAQKRDSK